ncbi:MAG: hypothetical protein LBG44_04565 [Gemmatimonadota bacterium]|jgi:hypothetical protein|nr:hypothetical protein [Gemmatimonadota bacterium]
MDKKPLDSLRRLLVREDGSLAALKKTPEQQEFSVTQDAMAAKIREIGGRGDLEGIVAAERTIVQNESDRHANSSGMKASLEEALKDLSRIDRGISYVTDPEIYKFVDGMHDKPKHRVHGVPRDEARQGFASQRARLQNLDKSRLTTEEKAVLAAREANLKVGEQLYDEMQRKALGIAPRVTGGRSQ